MQWGDSQHTEMGRLAALAKKKRHNMASYTSGAAYNEKGRKKDAQHKDVNVGNFKYA
jgi:hypothetical protein